MEDDKFYGIEHKLSIPPCITKVIGDVEEGGRDLIFGDIHGHISKVHAVLERAQYNDKKDRLIFVGDLIDRGPASDDVVKLLSMPNTYAVRGNHEHMFICAFHHIVNNRKAEYEDHYWGSAFLRNGGDWALEQPLDNIRSVYEVLFELPFFLIIERNDGTVDVVVHSQLTDRDDVTLEQIRDQELSYDDLMASIWSRGIMHYNEAPNAIGIGIDRVYCGHTPSRSPTYVGNYLNLDTGAAYGTNALTCFCPQTRETFSSK